MLWAMVVDFMMHTHAWHGKAPNDEQLEIGLAQNLRNFRRLLITLN